MKRKWMAMVLGVGLLGVPLTAQAVDVDAVKAQLTVYRTSGDVNDAELATGLTHILNDAKYWQSIGDTPSLNNYLEAFRITVDANSGTTITSAAASVLVQMAQ
jgi:hypothetical protein